MDRGTYVRDMNHIITRLHRLDSSIHEMSTDEISSRIRSIMQDIEDRGQLKGDE